MKATYTCYFFDPEFFITEFYSGVFSDVEYNEKVRVDIANIGYPSANYSKLLWCLKNIPASNIFVINLYDNCYEKWPKECRDALIKLISSCRNLEIFSINHQHYEHFDYAAFARELRIALSMAPNLQSIKLGRADGSFKDGVYYYRYCISYAPSLAPSLSEYLLKEVAFLHNVRMLHIKHLCQGRDKVTGAFIDVLNSEASSIDEIEIRHDKLLFPDTMKDDFVNSRVVKNLYSLNLYYVHLIDYMKNVLHNQLPWILPQMLSNNQGLCNLSVNGSNMFGSYEESAKTLCQALSESKRLQNLNISHNKIEGSEEEKVKILGHIFDMFANVDWQLKELSIANMYLGDKMTQLNDEAFNHFIEFLQNDKMLEMLHFECNALRHAGQLLPNIQHMAKALESNKNIEKIFIFDEEVGVNNIPIFHPAFKNLQGRLLDSHGNVINRVYGGYIIH